jgi:ABC-2 type transport system permease protein
VNTGVARAAVVIAKREFLERVKTKWFLIMTLIGPIGMVAMIVIPALLASQGAAGAKIDIVDRSGKIGPALASALDKDGWRATIVGAETPEDLELAKLRKQTINGFIDIPPDVLVGGVAIYKGDNATNQVAFVKLFAAVNDVVKHRRGSDAGVSPEQLDALLKPVMVMPIHSTGEAAGMSGMATFFLGFIVAFILYFATTLYGVNVMRSVVTEKSSRVVELMASATKPSAMMFGKIAGVAGAGIVQLTIWLAIGALALTYRAELLGLFGASSAGSMLPPLGIADVAVVLGFFLLGLLFYSSMYAAVGAMVSSEQDSQQAQLPVTMLLVIGMVSMNAITSAPRGGAAVAMTMVPFWSPMLMPMRFLLGGATTSELLTSLAILVASTFVVVRVAAKIYRVGILMYGKRPSLAELIRWLRY